MTPHTAPADPAQALPPPSELRPALAEALRRVRILRGLLRLSESVTRRQPVRQSRTEAPAHAAR